MGGSKKQSKKIRPIKGINSDVLPSLQVTDSEYRFALNAVNQTDEEKKGFGLAPESGNALHVQLPEGFEVRGLVYVEEVNKFVVFLHNGSENQIGIIDEDNRIYTEIVNDTNSDNQLNFSFDEWIDATTKWIVRGQCKHLVVYWSNNDTYKFADLDDPCCDYKDIILFDCTCPTTVQTSIQENGGRLPNGSYSFAIQLEDEDGNTTNWSKISQVIAISDQDNIAGELSSKAINLVVKNLSKHYNKINIAVIKTVLGITTVKKIKDNFYGGTQFSFLYSGDNGREIDTTLTEILARKNRFIKGKNLHQYGSRLLLYNTKPVFNLDYQKYANDINVGFVQYVVPSQSAKNYRQLRPNENYLFFIRWNYCDNTSSAAFPLINRAATESEKELVHGDDNCSDCELPRWKVEDTSIVEKYHLENIVDSNNGFEPDITIVSVPRTIETDVAAPKDEYADGEVPDIDKIVKDAMSTKDSNFENQLDCACEKLQAVKQGLLQNAPDEFLKLFANPDIMMLECMCNNRQ